MSNTLDLIIDQLDKAVESNGNKVVHIGHLRDMLIQANIKQSKLASKEFNKNDYILKDLARDQASDAFLSGANYVNTRDSVSYDELSEACSKWIQEYI